MADKKVRMIVKIAGTRDGKDWPAPGQTISVPEDEANTLIRNGQAAELNPPEESALADRLGAEYAVGGNRSIRSQMKPAAHADEVQAYHVPVLPGEVPAAEEAQDDADDANKDLIDVDAHKAQRANGPALDELKDAADHPAAKKAASRRGAKTDTKAEDK